MSLLSFNGVRSVKASLRKHKATGKVISSAILKARTGTDTFTNTTYRSAYIYPVNESSGFEGGGAGTQNTQAVLWQTPSEAYAPRVDDQLVDDSSQTWLITSVATRHNATTGYAVHDLSIARYA